MGDEGWQSGLGAFLGAHLEEGSHRRGSVREALELAGVRRAGGRSARQGREQECSESSETSSGETSGSEGDEEKGSEQGTERNAGRRNTFGKLEVEKLKRNLVRWRLDLKLDKCKSLRVAMSRIIQNIPALIDLLEPLAEFWASAIVSAVPQAEKDAEPRRYKQVDRQLLNSWLGELCLNVLVLYSGSITKPDESLKFLSKVGFTIHKNVADKHTGHSERVYEPLFRLDSLLDDESVETVFSPSIVRLSRDPRAECALDLAVCRPFLTSKASIDAGNIALVAGQVAEVMNLCVEQNSSDKCSPIQAKVMFTVLRHRFRSELDLTQFLFKAVKGKVCGPLPALFLRGAISSAVSVSLAHDSADRVDENAADVSDFDIALAFARSRHLELEDKIEAAEEQLRLFGTDSDSYLAALSVAAMQATS